MVKILSIPKVDQPGSTKWSSLFEVKPSGKSSFPPVKTLPETEKGSCAIAIPDEIVDHSIRSMASTLIGKILGPRPNIDDVKTFIKKKWALKGQVSVMAMAKGFMSFDFTCMEDLSNILREGQWATGCSTLVLQKWSSKLYLNASFFVQALVWVRLPELPLEFWNEDIFWGLARNFGELLSIDPIIASKRCLNYARIYIGVREGTDMPETVAFHSKLGVHIRKLIYEIVPFACFLCLKVGHKVNQCPRADKKKTKDFDTSDKSKKKSKSSRSSAKGKKN